MHGRKLLLVLAAMVLLTAPVAAQPATPAPNKPEMMENCPGLVAQRTPRALPAAFHLATLASDQVRLSYAGHSTFMVESPRGVKIATDYNDYIKPRGLPDVATM